MKYIELETAPFIIGHTYAQMAILLAAILLVSIPSSPAQSQPTRSQPPASAAASPIIMTYSRMVNLDVVVEDGKGHHLKGLTARDFEILEQTPTKSGKKHEQKIADVREVQTASLAPPAAPPANLLPGVYTNAVAAQKETVPATVLVVDGLNTEIQHQAQVHRQMLRILRQLPPNVPVAVLLMGDRLTLLQGFTTDPELLQNALSQAESVAGQGLGHRDPTDDPDAVDNLLNSLEGSGGYASAMLGAVQGFDQMVYASTLTQRFLRSDTALLSLARSLAGYPGRKNVLWLSTSFPLTLHALPTTDEASDSNHGDLAGFNYWGRMKVLNNALSDAKVAVYPVDIGGVRNLQVYSASNRPPNPYASPTTSVDAQWVSAAASREIEMMNVEQDTMHSIADDTGGKVCSGNNDIADCVRRAVEDSSDFYEISYYPDSSDWNGEYRNLHEGQGS